MTRYQLAAIGVTLLLTATACGSTDHSAHQAPPAGSDAQMMGAVPGSAGDPADADRTVEIAASDRLRFKPSSIAVDAGEVITFVISNGGETEHEFVLGDRAYQEMHEADMPEGHVMMDMNHAVSLAPGETKGLTWVFTESGEVLFGCHEPGHYEGGMVGTITVS